MYIIHYYAGYDKYYPHRTKDSAFIYCALKKVLELILPMAAEMGVAISQVVHKVCIFIDYFLLKIDYCLLFTDRPSLLTVLEQWNGARAQGACSGFQCHNFSYFRAKLSQQSNHKTNTRVTNYIYEINDRTGLMENSQ